MTLKRTLADLARDARSHVEEIDCDELAAAMDGPAEMRPILIDIREPDEAARGSIPGGTLIPRGILERDIEKTLFNNNVHDDELDQPIVCYCGGGSRSLLAGEQLKKMGFTNVMSLEGGFAAWGESGRPVEAGKKQ
jgi:rhodanese-related sulfurtransferase